MTITKVYELKSLVSGIFITSWCGCNIQLNFRSGKGSQIENRASLITSDKFVQDAIEHDARYGKVFYCAATYENEAAARNDRQMNGRFATDEKPARQRRGRGELFGESSAPVVEKEKPAEPTEEETGKTFSNINDAVYYLEEELGVEVPEGADVKEVLKANGITIEE